MTIRVIKIYQSLVADLEVTPGSVWLWIPYSNPRHWPWWALNMRGTVVRAAFQGSVAFPYEGWPRQLFPEMRSQAGLSLSLGFSVEGGQGFRRGCGTETLCWWVDNLKISTNQDWCLFVYFKCCLASGWLEISGKQEAAIYVLERRGEWSSLKQQVGIFCVFS